MPKPPPLKNIPQIKINKAPSLKTALSFIDEDANAAQEIPLSKIILPENQTRRYISSDKIAELAKSIESKGVLVPILVTPIGDGSYELVYGQSRYKACELIEKETIPALIQELSAEERLEVALIENLQRNELSAIDEVDGILNLIQLKFKCDEIAAKGMIAEAVSHQKGKGTDYKFIASAGNNVVTQTNNDSPSSEDDINACVNFLVEVIETTSQNTLIGFFNHKLSLLNLPEMILTELRAGNLEHSKAKAIATKRITDEKFRQQLLDEAIAYKLSIREIKSRIAEQYPKVTQSNIVRQRWQDTNKLIEKSQIWGDSKKEDKLNRLLAEIEALLN